MSTKPGIQRDIVALNFRNKSVSFILSSARHYLEMLANNSYVPNPFPPLEVIKIQADKVENAMKLTQLRKLGATQKMHVETGKLMILLKSLANQVEWIANRKENAPLSRVIIKSCGMSLKKPHGSHKRIFRASPGRKMNSVALSSKQVVRSTCIYQMTTTPLIESSWKIIYCGINVNYEIDGLVSGVRYYFRYAQNIKGIQYPWSHVLNVLID
jgi:hypothetical protein